jgi:chemotaxis protein MotB
LRRREAGIFLYFTYAEGCGSLWSKQFPMLPARDVSSSSPRPARTGGTAIERLATAVVFSAAAHGLALLTGALVVIRVVAQPEAPAHRVILVEPVPALRDSADPGGNADAEPAAGASVATHSAFGSDAERRLAAVEDQITGELARRAEDARAQSDALAAEVARGQAEQVRLAEHNQALSETLAARDAELTAAAARATAAEQAAVEARRQAAEAAAWKAAYDDLARALQREIAAKEVAIRRLGQGVSLSISDQILFPSGATDLSPQGSRMLDQIAGVLQRLRGRRARVEGHTDDVPIGPGLRSRYPTNWELSTARATAVVKYLRTHGVDPHRLAAAGYADTRPVAPNTSEQGRARNRRTEIVLVPEEPLTAPGADRGT